MFNIKIFQIIKLASLVFSQINENETDFDNKFYNIDDNLDPTSEIITIDDISETDSDIEDEWRDFQDNELTVEGAQREDNYRNALDSFDNQISSEVNDLNNNSDQNSTNSRNTSHGDENMINNANQISADNEFNDTANENCRE